MPLQVVIVGAGIAGLAAAIGARRAGHSVTIYERSTFANETGAAMYIPPNASGPLLRWGLDPIRAKLVTAKGVMYQDPFTMKLLHHIPMGDAIAERFGAHCYFAHRVDIHQELKRLALEEDGVGSPATIHLSAEVISYNSKEPSVTLVSGKTVRADIVIAADGIHSTAANAVLETPPQPQSSDMYNHTYRFLIPATELMDDPETAPFIKEADGKLVVLPDNKGWRRLVCYPCRNGTVYNFSGVHYKPVMTSKTEDWHAGVDASELRKTYKDFHPSLASITRKAKDVKCWPLLYRDPVPTWTKENMVLIGDAAHPMLPNQGQGAAMAIEDAVALGICLCGADPSHVEARLAAFEKIRINRASAMQVLSGAGQEQVALVAKDAAKYFDDENAVPQNPKELTDFAFGYDVATESLGHLQQLNPAFEVPVSFFS